MNFLKIIFIVGLLSLNSLAEESEFKVSFVETDRKIEKVYDCEAPIIFNKVAETIWGRNRYGAWIEKEYRIEANSYYKYKIIITGYEIITRSDGQQISKDKKKKYEVKTVSFPQSAITEVWTLNYTTAEKLRDLRDYAFNLCKENRKQFMIDNVISNWWWNR